MDRFVLFVTLLAGCCAARAAEPVAVTFTVRPDVLPTNAQVYLAGNHPALGAWSADGVALEKTTDGAWTRALAFEPGARLEFKVTLGSWETEALNGDGSAPGNSTLNVATNTEVILRVARWKNETNEPQGQVTGRVDKYLNMEYEGLLPRDVHVWIPPSYDFDVEKRYPVLYMHDAQQVFDPKTSTHGVDWQVDETATRLIAEGNMQEIIVVATTSTKDRNDEYSDTPKGALYADFIIKKLKPFVDQKYRTLTDREHTAVMGSSMGGRISFLLAWNHPEVFSMAGCLSSALFGKMVKPVAEYDGPPKNIRLYLDNGGIGLEKILQPGNDWMLEVLPKKGFVFGKDFIWFQDLTAEHNEAAWAKRVWMPLEFFFGPGERPWVKDLAPVPSPLFAARDKIPVPIIASPAICVAGRKQTLHEWQGVTEIPALWTEVLRERGPEQDGPFVGVSFFDPEHPADYDYIAGRVVKKGGGADETIVPPNAYAVFKHHGPLTNLSETLDYVSQWWIPQSEYVAAVPSLLRFDTPNVNDADFSAELWVPVKPEP
jgi:predicted alpha/beta superfamily hydrolase/predicted transcriptional regulator YdeE